MAASLYWIGRYVERAEQTARITDGTFSHTLAMGSTPEAEARRRRHWDALLDIVGERSAFPEDSPADEENVAAHVAFASDNPNSIVQCIAHARENARTMRHQIATEMWEVLNRFHLDAQRPARRRRSGVGGTEHVTRFCRSSIEFSQLFQGVAASTMPREEGWHFLRAGIFLERAEKTARALSVNYRMLVGDDVPSSEGLRPGPDFDPLPWANVLRSLSAHESYHRVWSTRVEPAGVLEFLTLSPYLPRSIRYSIGHVERALGHITEDALSYAGGDWSLGADRESEARRELGRLNGELAYGRLDDLIAPGVIPYLLDVQRRCYRIGELIEAEFFAHRPLTANEVLA
jgi:uncharacterized alpha-E superfamily protein